MAWPWPTPAARTASARSTWCSPYRSRRSRSPTAARPSASSSRSGARRARRRPRPSGARPRGRRASGPGTASVVAGASTAWARLLAALAASSGAGWEALSAGSLRTIAGRTRGVASGTPRAWRCSHVISAAESVVGTAARARARARGGERLGRVDDAAAAERDDEVAPSTTLEQVAGDLVDRPGADAVHRGGAVGEPRGLRQRPVGRQQRVALAEQRRARRRARRGRSARRGRRRAR